jgi:hypothetical protein
MLSCMHRRALSHCSPAGKAPNVLRVGIRHEGSRLECPRPGIVVANPKSTAWLEAAVTILSEIQPPLASMEPIADPQSRPPLLRFS